MLLKPDLFRSEQGCLSQCLTAGALDSQRGNGEARAFDKQGHNHILLFNLNQFKRVSVNQPASQVGQPPNQTNQVQLNLNPISLSKRKQRDRPAPAE
jgi:hypothetical protein